MRRRALVKEALFPLLLILVPLLTAIVCIGMGRYSLGAAESARVLYNGIRHGAAAVDPRDYSIIFSIRLPRILMAMVCGAGLSVAGAAFQALFSNPLATPDTLGVAKGASFGACLALLLGMGLIGVQLTALVFGLLAMLLTMKISRQKGKSAMVMVILSGIVVSALFEALVSLVKYWADPEDDLPSITYWLMGSLTNASYKTLLLGAIPVAVGIAVIFLLRWKLNVLSLTEEEAASMGIPVKQLRTVVIIAATLITASCISMCGMVVWIGLLAPHLARMAVGSNNQKLVPASISIGAVFMLVIDTTARAASASEIPISILTALIGAPFFIFLLRKTGGVWL